LDLARDYVDVGRGLVVPVARRGRDVVQAAAASTTHFAVTTTMRLTVLAIRPVRAVLR